MKGRGVKGATLDQAARGRLDIQTHEEGNEKVIIVGGRVSLPGQISVVLHLSRR